MNSTTIIKQGKLHRLVILAIGKQCLGVDGIKQHTFQGEAWFAAANKEMMVPIKGVIEDRDHGLSLKYLDYGVYYPNLSDFLSKHISAAMQTALKNFHGEGVYSGS